MIHLQTWANLNGVTETDNTWIQAICESLGITQPNGTWWQSLSEYLGENEPVNGSWVQAICRALNITEPVNGTWIEALANNGIFSNKIGVIMQNTFTNWTSEGTATFTNNGTSIAMSGGNGTTTNLYYYNAYSTCLENINWSVTATIDNLTTGGFGVGLKSRNAYFGGGIGRSACVQFQVAGVDSGKLKFYSGSTLIQTSASILSFSIGDQIKLTYEFVGDTWYFYAENLTTSQLITDSYQFTDYTSPESLPYLTNTCSPCLWTFGGSQTVTSFILSSQQQKGVDLVVIGDSKTKGYFAGSFANRFSNLLGFTNNAGAGDGIIHVELRISELIKIKPKNVVLHIGCNDIREGTASGTWQSAYNNVVNTLTSAGIVVWNCLPMPETTLNLTSLKSWIESNQVNLIDLWTPFLSGTSAIKSIYSTDNVHPNSDAQALIGNIINNGVGFSSIDPYAQTYADRISLGATETQYVDTFVKGLKSDGLWTKMIAVYPFMGASATNHKWNLKEPANADGAYRINFSGGWTHSATGAKPNGSTGYAETNMLQSTTSQNSASLSYYSREDAYTNSIDMGCGNDATDFLMLELNRNAAGGVVSTIVNSNTRTGPLGVGDQGSKGFYVGSRTAANSQKLYKNGVAIQTSSAASTGTTNYKIILSAYDGPSGIVAHSSKEVCFAHVGTGLDDTDVSNLNTRVQTLQTLLNRNV